MIEHFYAGKTVPLLILSALILLSFYFILNAAESSHPRSARYFSVITRCSGATAEEIEKTLTVPMENSIYEIAGIQEMKSFSEYSNSRIDLKASASVNTADFIPLLQDRVDRAYSCISEKNPAVQKPLIAGSSDALSAVFSLSISSRNLSAGSIRAIVESSIEPSFRKIPGVGEVNIYGGTVPEIQIRVDQDSAAAAGYSCSDIALLLQKSNIETSAGCCANGRFDLPVYFDGLVDSMHELKNLPVSPELILADIADIEFSSREPDSISRYNGEEQISLFIKPASDDITGLCRRLRKETAEWETCGYETRIMIDRGAELEEKRLKIIYALITGIITSSLLLLFFSISISRIPFLRIVILLIIQPVIVIISLGIIRAAGLSLDRFTLAGLAVGTGMILDSALLMTEAVEKGVRTLSRVFKPLISSTLSTFIALLPLLSLRNETPDLMNLLTALTVMLAVSLLLSIFFIPAFNKKSAFYGKSAYYKKHDLKSSASHQAFGRFRAAFDKLLLTCTDRPYAAVMTGILLFCAGIFSFSKLPFLIDQPSHSSVISARIQLPSGTAPAYSDRIISEYCDSLSRIGGINWIQSTAERSGGRISVDFNDRMISRDAVIERIKFHGSTLPGGFIYLPDENVSGASRLTVSITGPDTSELKKKAGEALSRLISSSAAAEGLLHFREGPPAYCFSPDSEAHASAGISPLQTAFFLKWNIQGPVADKFIISEREYDIRVMSKKPPAFRLTDLDSLKIPFSSGTAFCRLDQLGCFEAIEGTGRINRLNRRHAESFTITGNCTNPVQLHAQIWKELDNISLAHGYSFIPSNKTIETEELYRRMIIQFIFAVILIFLLLAVERESIIQPLIILLQLPVIVAVPLIVMFFASVNIGPETIIGFTLISGMGINNGILIMDNIDRGIDYAVRARFKCLVLTTLTSVLGIAPLLFTRDPLFTGLAVILTTGLSASLLSGFFLMPALIRITEGSIPAFSGLSFSKPFPEDCRHR